MTDGPDRVHKGQRIKTDYPLANLASDVLKTVAKQRVCGRGLLDVKSMDYLRRSVLRMDTSASVIVEKLRGRGLSDCDLVDHYIPAVARRLGADWVADRLGFADVTIGTSRLQSMLRELMEGDGSLDHSAHKAGVAVIVMASDFHMLGAMVLTMQLRRLGVSARLLIGVEFEDSIFAHQAHKYDAVFISASSTKMLPELQSFIKKLRREAGKNTPIVLGGSILGSNEGIETLTGADFATTDVVEALQLCQLASSQFTTTIKTKVE